MTHTTRQTTICISTVSVVVSIILLIPSINAAIAAEVSTIAMMTSDLEHPSLSLSSNQEYYFIEQSNLTVGVKKTGSEIQYYPTNTKYQYRFTVIFAKLEFYDSKVASDEIPVPIYEASLKTAQWTFDQQSGAPSPGNIVIASTIVDLTEYKGNDNKPDSNGDPTNGPGQPAYGPPTNETTSPSTNSRPPISAAVKFELVFALRAGTTDEIKIDYRFTFLKPIEDIEAMGLVQETMSAAPEDDGGAENFKFCIQGNDQVQTCGNSEAPSSPSTGTMRKMTHFSTRQRPGIDFIKNGLETGFFSWAPNYTVENKSIALNSGYIVQPDALHLHFFYDLQPQANATGGFAAIVHDPEIGIYFSNIRTLQELMEEVQRFVIEHIQSIVAGLAIGVAAVSIVLVRAQRIAKKRNRSITRLEENRYYRK